MTYTLSREEFATLMSNADIYQGDDAEQQVRTDYSGRHMYGRKCLAIVVDRHGEGINEALFTLELANVIVEAANAQEGGYELDGADMLDALREVMSDLDPSRDSMGLGTVVYWPSVRVEDK